MSTTWFQPYLLDSGSLLFSNNCLPNKNSVFSNFPLVSPLLICFFLSVICSVLHIFLPELLPLTLPLSPFPKHFYSHLPLDSGVLPMVSQKRALCEASGRNAVRSVFPASQCHSRSPVGPARGNRKEQRIFQCRQHQAGMTRFKIFPSFPSFLKRGWAELGGNNSKAKTHKHTHTHTWNITSHTALFAEIRQGEYRNKVRKRGTAADKSDQILRVKQQQPKNHPLLFICVLMKLLSLITGAWLRLRIHFNAAPNRPAT